MIIDSQQILDALIGGLFIGLSATILMLFKGRIAGISGILAGSFSLEKENLWKLIFIIGLIAGGFIILFINPQQLTTQTKPNLLRLISAGLFVGFGTRLGSGCTSGHGVCGISRFSKRSITATLIFIISGIITVAFFGMPL